MTNQKEINELLEIAIRVAHESMKLHLEDEENEQPISRLAFLKDVFVPVLKELAEIEGKVNSFNR